MSFVVQRYMGRRSGIERMLQSSVKLSGYFPYAMKSWMRASGRLARRGRKERRRRRFDGKLGGVHRAGVRAAGGVHSASELDDGVEEEVCGDLHRL
jgi:hypothetical protein